MEIIITKRLLYTPLETFDVLNQINLIPNNMIWIPVLLSKPKNLNP